jgi:DNA-binding MarR family transcriptional regulator
MFKLCRRMSTEPSPIVVRAWARLARAQQTGLSQIEASLKQAGFPPLAWYDALLELDRAGEAGLRPYELEREMLLPQYSLSRLLDRIEAAGHIARHPCTEDGRGHRVTITPAGQELRRRMWPVYAAAIQTRIGMRLSQQEATILVDLLGKLINPPTS